MTKSKLLQEGQSYTFRSYFEFPYETDDVLAELGYSFVRAHLSLPKTEQPLLRLPELQQRIEETLPFIRLSNEAARRETLVSPVLLEVVRYCQCQIRIEYPLNVNNWLKGNLDYLLRGQREVIVIEAKNDDLTRGFTQLAAELIALAQVEESAVLYGAVTIGDVWQFGRLDRETQQLTQDLNLFRVPADLKELVGILVGLLS
ncbi:MAG: hypothetical protein AAGC54_05415 [Cyanobacteria bacterium P01_F01_bin.4]